MFRIFYRPDVRDDIADLYFKAFKELKIPYDRGFIYTSNEQTYRKIYSCPTLWQRIKLAWLIAKYKKEIES